MVSIGTVLHRTYSTWRTQEVSMRQRETTIVQHNLNRVHTDRRNNRTFEELSKLKQKDLRVYVNHAQTTYLFELRNVFLKKPWSSV